LQHLQHLQLVQHSHFPIPNNLRLASLAYI
jgi:hypothetical protein